MGTFRTILISLVIIGIIISFLLYFFVYMKQENFIFFPEKLSSEYQFRFKQDYEEIFIKCHDGIKLNGLLFKAEKTKGLIFYLHGNAGSLRSWGDISPYYTALGYDLFILDYRGYGKSESQITSESQLYSDIQAAYDKLISSYTNKSVIILGYSIGTGPAAWLASHNSPDLLILQAPYYSLADLKDQWYPFIPDFMIKYKFETFQYIENVEAPVIIFHGDRDEVISYQSSLKLKKHFKQWDELRLLKNQVHNGMSYNPEYRDLFQYHLRSLTKKNYQSF